MKKIAVLLASILFMGLQVLHAQKQISGTITSSDDGSTLPGVTVQAKGVETTGAVTNLDGVYQISVPEDAQILVFSFVGMKDVEVSIEGRTVIDVSMKSDILALDQVVVVAYGTQKRGEITGSVATMDAEQISAAPVESVDKALQGSVSGVYVSSTSGSPGSQPVIRIRGMSSINAGNSPLIVIDGVPVISGNYSSWRDGSVLSTISNQDVQNVSVLKDAAAMSIYGSRAANGVILITTKRGSAGKTTYDFSVKYGISQLPNSEYRKLNAEEEITLKREGVANANALGYTTLTPDDVFPLSLLDRGGTFWPDLLFRDGKTKETMFSARGGNEKTKFYSSISYFQQDGIVIKNDLERITARVNLDHKASDFFSFGSQTSITRNTTNNIETWHLGWENPFAAAMWLPTYKYPYDVDGNYATDLSEVGGFNPIAARDRNTRGSESFRIMNNVYLDFKILEGLHFRTEASMDYYQTSDVEIYTPYATWSDSPDGVHYESNGIVTQYTFKNLLQYDKTFATKHNVSVLAGFETEQYNYYYSNATAKGIDELIPYIIPGMEFTDVNSNDIEYAYVGILSRLRYNYENKYYFGASFRRDGSSKFGINNQYANFGSVSAGWRVTSESFMPEIGWLNDLKIRGSYGTSGNSSIDEYETRATYYVTAYNGTGALLPSVLANSNLTWEKNAQMDFGIDFSVLNDRLTGSIEYFNRKSSDMLLDVPLSATTGFTTALRNTATMVNKGMEVELHSTNLDGALVWETGFNITTLKNEITDLPNGNILVGNYAYMVGQDMSALTPYAYAGVNPANGKEMYWHIEYEDDANGNPDYTKEISRTLTEDSGQASRHLNGKTNPDLMGGIANTFKYKGIELYVHMNWVIGRQVLVTANKYVNHDGRGGDGLTNLALRRWQQPGDITDVPQYIYNNPASYLWDHDRFLNNGDYLRIKTISLTYNFPKVLLDKVKINSFKVFAQASNLYTFHNVDAYDPDRSGYRGFSYPNPRTFTVGLNLGL